jgi:hypothetical protein
MVPFSTTMVKFQFYVEYYTSSTQSLCNFRFFCPLKRTSAGRPDTTSRFRFRVKSILFRLEFPTKNLETRRVHEPGGHFLHENILHSFHLVSLLLSFPLCKWFVHLFIGIVCNETRRAKFTATLVLFSSVGDGLDVSASAALVTDSSSEFFPGLLPSTKF